MQILTTPNDHLTQKSSPINSVDKKLIKFIDELSTTLLNKKNPEGVGLSAPQVGKNIRVFVTYLNRGSKKDIKVYINPEIINQSKGLNLGGPPDKPFLEGCLSIPGILGAVYRHSWVKLKYQTITANQLQSQTKRFESFPARVIQHELDHLNGILFTKRTIDQGLPLYQEDGDKLLPLELTN